VSDGGQDLKNGYGIVSVERALAFLKGPAPVEPEPRRLDAPADLVGPAPVGCGRASPSGRQLTVGWLILWVETIFRERGQAIAGCAGERALTTIACEGRLRPETGAPRSSRKACDRESETGRRCGNSAGLAEPPEPILTGNATADALEVHPHALESYDALIPQQPHPEPAE
jgi:hypothetical protein